LDTFNFKTAIEGWDRSKTYLLYCRSGKRSQVALAQMKASGFERVYDLQGGYPAWEKHKPEQIGKIQYPAHRVVIQVSSGDSLVWKGLMNNLKHLHEGWQYTAEMVVVTHGPGLDLLRNDRSTQQEKIKHFSQLGIQFIACENTMLERKISKEQIVKEAGFVKMGIGEVVRLQETGWSYIKSGY
jgi:intracellular sulfur oxidation DsrE/DsrF family protein